MSDRLFWPWVKLRAVKPYALARGQYCRKRVPGCFCRVGFPVEYQCERCRSDEPRDSFCECGPQEAGVMWTEVSCDDFAVRWKLHENGCSFTFEVCERDRYAGQVIDDREDCPVLGDEWPEGGHVLDGFCKWDGCTEIGQRDTDCGLHFCGPEPDPWLGRVMREVYAIGRGLFAGKWPDVWGGTPETPGTPETFGKTRSLWPMVAHFVKSTTGIDLPEDVDREAVVKALIESFRETSEGECGRSS